MIVKKDSIRDYATEAFRFFASCGCLSSEQIKERLREEIYDASKREMIRLGTPSMPSDKTAMAVMKAEDELEYYKAELLDILAVEKTLARLSPPMKRAVEIVYFTRPQEPITKGELSGRVHQAEIEIPASERNIYYWLREARRIFAQERGLRQ